MIKVTKQKIFKTPNQSETSLIKNTNEFLTLVVIHIVKTTDYLKILCLLFKTCF